MQYIAVFDTNILLSALLSTNGNPFRCLALAKIGQIESVTCQEILDEFAEKLLVKFKFSEEMTQLAAREVRDFSRLVEIAGTFKLDVLLNKYLSRVSVLCFWREFLKKKHQHSLHESGSTFNKLG
jgi:putative PIN family toxin of toxin-antitoxin system